MQVACEHAGPEAVPGQNLTWLMLENVRMQGDLSEKVLGTGQEQGQEGEEVSSSCQVALVYCPKSTARRRKNSITIKNKSSNGIQLKLFLNGVSAV